MKKKLQQAFAHQTPDVLQSVLSACENEKGELSVENEKWHNATSCKKSKFRWVGFAAAAAILAVVVGIGFTALRNAPQETEPTQLYRDDTVPTDSTEPTETSDWLQIPEHFSYTVDYAAAMQIALDDAQLDCVRNYECEAAEGQYAISFKAGNLIYYYTIDGTNGVILSKTSRTNPTAADEQAAIDATLRFFEDFTAVTFLAEDRDLTPHLAPADAEIWTRADYFAPYANTNNYRAGFYLTNQRAYILDYADYWRSVRQSTVLIDFEASYQIESVYIKGGFAQVCLLEGKTFRYERAEMYSCLSDPYAVMLQEIDGQWKVFDIPCDAGGVDKDLSTQPPLVTEAYKSNYVVGDMVCEQAFPQIMLESAYAAQVNEEIYSRIDNFRASRTETMIEGISYQYDWYVHGDLLTVVIDDMNTAFEPVLSTTVYTLRISDGAQATREEILAAAGVSEADFIEKARWILANLFENDVDYEDIDNFLTWMENNPGKDGIGMRRAFGRTVCLQNLQEAVPYLDRDGKLCFQAKNYQIAGADFVWETYEFDQKVEESPFYDRFMANCIGIIFEIYDYECEESIGIALAAAGVKKDAAEEITCEAVYFTDGASYHIITVKYGGKLSKVFVDIYTGEVLEYSGTVGENS